MTRFRASLPSPYGPGYMRDDVDTDPYFEERGCYCPPSLRHAIAEWSDRRVAAMRAHEATPEGQAERAEADAWAVKFRAEMAEIHIAYRERKAREE